ncbi:ABC transporter permease subunit [uncultured Ruthenibacterium sp.]|uniref:ABC transporter permease subunit n=1 Tax=uncultured Ruthenibacterium sp. TaxID=1905347 RepID=UPI00349EA247
MQKNKKNKRSTASVAAQRMLLGGLPQEEEEVLQSPLQMAFGAFVKDKIAMIGVILFVFIFLCCIFLPYFFPIDLYYQDVTQANVAPGFGMLNVPNQLKNNAQDLSVGSSFSVGLDKDGNVYEWGTFPNSKLKNIPSTSETGKLVQVSAGLDHIIAANEDGQIFTWGNDRMGLNTIPMELRSGGNDIKQILAGYQISLVLTEDGEMYNWGSDYLLNIVYPEGVQGNIEKFAASTNIVMVLTKDGEVVPLTSKASAYTNIPEEIQGDVVDLALTDESAAAVTSDGRVYTWGNNIKKTLDVPEEIQGQVASLSSGRYHFTAVLKDGTLCSWGDNTHGQTNAPEGVAVSSVESGYYANYAITEDGSVVSWGLKGYLMGTDSLGRDLFRRLLVGGRMTMTVGAIAVIISTIIGIVVGGISGYKGGKVDNLLMRLTEIVSSIPFLPFCIILSSILGNSISETQRIILIMCILGLLSWPGIARLVRGSVLAEREQEFVTAAKALGVREFGIIFRHIVPNIITVIIVNATLNFATCMLTESSLSFIGFGVTEPNATWGNMLTGAQNGQVIENYWWRWAFPALMLGICTISINCIGDGLRDAIDPKSKER